MYTHEPLELRLWATPTVLVCQPLPFPVCSLIICIHRSSITIILSNQLLILAEQFHYCNMLSVLPMLIGKSTNYLK